MVYVWMGEESAPIEIKQTINSFQFIPKYIGIYLGRSSEAVPGFEGDIEEWYFEFGDGTWESPDYVDCEVDSTYCATYGQDDCVDLYSECNFEGTRTRLCADTPFTDINYEVKSIDIL